MPNHCNKLLIIWALLCLPFTLVADAVDFDTQTVTHALAQEPPSLNSMRATDQISFFLLGHLNEGLMRYDRRGRLTGGVAERWELTEQGATFWLRKDARWSDGKPVTAHDFVYAWRQIVDPKTASEYSFILYPIKNGAQINQGKLPSDSLGATAIDDHTLTVTFERPNAYFLQLTAFGVYFPVREDFHQQKGEQYSAEHTDLLYNGPFVLSKWVHGAALMLEKNPHYWNREKIRLNRINIPFITSDPNTRVNLYKDNKVAYTDGISKEVLSNLLKEKIKIKTFLNGSLGYLEFNIREGKVTANTHFRKAMQAVFNPKKFVNKIIGIPGTKPGRSLFPRWLKGVERSFRKEYPVRKVAVDLEQAKRYLQLAKQELGIEQFPPLVFLTGDTPSASKQAEYFQNLFKEKLGLELLIDKQIFKQRLAKMSSGSFDIVAAGWGPDYNDVMTFGDLFASWNLNNRGRYKSEQYDHWVSVAQNAIEPKTRMDAMAKIQQIVVEDVPILVVAESSSVYLQHPKLKGLVRSVVGADPSYIFAHIVR